MRLDPGPQASPTFVATVEGSPPELSIVAPMYNEETNIHPFVDAVSVVLGGAGGTYNSGTNPFGGVPLTLSTSNIITTITAMASVLD